jgi:uncharacterized protein (TIGR03118 family)
MKKAQISIAVAAAVWVGCGVVLADVPNAFVQTNLVANSTAYNPQIVDPNFTDSWGIALRPPGAGGHIWINQAFGGTSSTYIGDVPGNPLHQDGLTSVTLDTPAFTDHGTAFDTGIVYNSSSDFTGQATEFPVSGASRNANTGVASTYSGSSKFIFCTEDGCINAWASNTANAMDSAPVILDYSKASNGNFNTLGDIANPVFSGLAITTNAVTPGQVGTAEGNHIFVADFRNNNINVFDDQWQNVTSNYSFQTPANLLSTTGVPLHIFNIQDLGGHLFATYAAFNPNGDEGLEEIDQNGDGAVVEYNEDGSLVKEFTDSTNTADKLDAPWGEAIAPAGWGPFGGDLLVTNFGDNGTISVFNTGTGAYVGKLDDTNGNPISIDGIWGLTFGNGVSLGDANSLYFTAGPASEFDGLLGKLTVAPVPEPTAAGLMSLSALGLLRRRKRSL